MDNIKSNKLNISGKVIEIYDRNNQKFAKVYFQSLCLEVLIDLIKDVHLADKLNLETHFVIDKAEKEISDR